MNAELNELVGKTITRIEGMVRDSEIILFTTSEGYVYKMYHIQDCCELVSIDDVCGDVNDLIGSPLLVA